LLWRLYTAIPRVAAVVGIRYHTKANLGSGAKMDVYFLATGGASMLIQPTSVILLLLFFAFWVTILWAVVISVKTLRRIAASMEQLVRQKDGR
jgi:hypothetical protein